MKYLLSILCLFIFSCDSGGGDAENTPIEEFQYPLAVGNEWNYMIVTSSTPSESWIGSQGLNYDEYSDTTIVDTSYLTISISDIVNLQHNNLGVIHTEDDVYEINYLFSRNIFTDFSNPQFVEFESKYYLKNTTDGLVFLAAEDYYLMYNLPGFTNSDNCSDIIEEYECSPEGICIDGPNAGENCNSWCDFQILEEITGITHFEPYIKLIEYPVQLGNSWLSILNLDYEVTTYCENNTINEMNFSAHPLGIGGYEVSDIDGNNCFEITQYTNMDNLANDINLNHKSTYCKNIGLYKNEYYGQLGEQTSVDEFGTELGILSNEFTKTMTLIDYIIY